jgi:hypothetical protein
MMPLVHNVFAAAQGRLLSQSDIDAYIAPSVGGTDRQTLLELMAMMPPNARGDVVYYDGTHVISNNPALLPFINTTKPVLAPSVNRPVTAASVRSVRPDIVGGRSPPDPFTGTGPYVREVGNCGFTSGWGIVNLECNSSHFADNPDPNTGKNEEGGYLYYGIGVFYLPNGTCYMNFANSVITCYVQTNAASANPGGDLTITYCYWAPNQTQHHFNVPVEATGTTTFDSYIDSQSPPLLQYGFSEIPRNATVSAIPWGVTTNSLDRPAVPNSTSNVQIWANGTWVPPTPPYDVGYARRTQTDSNCPTAFP